MLKLQKKCVIDTKNSCLEYINYSISNTSVTKEVAKQMDIMKHKCFTKITNTEAELNKLSAFLNNEKSKFLSDLTEFNDYINSLSLIEISALYHILVSLLILITAFNILSVFLVKRLLNSLTYNINILN